MYVFGGRDVLGNDLGDLMALSISERRWYVFQNTGTSPSPRSGHSMTTHGENIYIIGGESTASNPETRDELTMMYILDTTKMYELETTIFPPPLPPPKYISSILSSDSGANEDLVTRIPTPPLPTPKFNSSFHNSSFYSSDSGANESFPHRLKDIAEVDPSDTIDQLYLDTSQTGGDIVVTNFIRTENP